MTFEVCTCTFRPVRGEHLTCATFTFAGVMDEHLTYATCTFSCYGRTFNLNELHLQLLWGEYFAWKAQFTIADAIKPEGLQLVYVGGVRLKTRRDSSSRSVV